MSQEQNQQVNISNTGTNDQSSTASQNGIYRFKFGERLIGLIEAFAVIHKNDSKDVFKENWEAFLKENDEAIKEEELELSRKGYNGNINEKMYKSARYYFRLKTSKPIQTRRNYVGLNRSLINTMDDFIRQKQALNIRNNEIVFKPSNGYTEFAQRYSSILQKEIGELNKHQLGPEESNIKIKKTFKNRYFQIIKKPELNN